MIENPRTSSIFRNSPLAQVVKGNFEMVVLDQCQYDAVDYTTQLPHRGETAILESPRSLTRHHGTPMPA